ncbi:MAG: hypothetical protein MZV64_37000 [Ignavibacteriales bacterium]|nr:hypothetical protein [Ignavibacteriales bacterium]
MNLTFRRPDGPAHSATSPLLRAGGNSASRNAGRGSHPSRIQGVQKWTGNTAKSAQARQAP